MATSQYAHALYRAHGDKAEAEVAQRERLASKAGKTSEAQTRRKVRASIRQIRGANQK